MKANHDQHTQDRPGCHKWSKDLMGEKKPQKRQQKRYVLWDVAIRVKLIYFIVVVFFFSWNVENLILIYCPVNQTDVS